MRTNSMKAKWGLTGSMLIFGTIGLFRRKIDLPSSVIACFRGIIGAAFLLAVVLLGRKKMSGTAIRKNLPVLLLSGAAIGLNWVFLFEAYEYTTVACATLLYYMAPVIVILVSPFVLKESFSLMKAVCVAVAIIGMVMASGVIGEGGGLSLKGTIFGLLAAVLYASVIIMNKKMGEIGPYDKTIIQLFVAALVVIPYILVTEDVASFTIDTKAIIMLVLVGIVHTGIAYALYFGAMDRVPAQTVAFLSYIDPVVALILSMTVLGEAMNIVQLVGAALVLGASAKQL